MAGKPSYDELEQRVRELEAAEEMRAFQDKALARLFDLSPDLLCAADFDGYLRIFNSAFERTLGYSRQKLRETPFIEFVHADDKAATRIAMQQLASGQSVSDFENRFRCQNGVYKWFAWNSVPVTEEGFEYAVARDITQQKVTQRQLETQRDLFDNVLSNVPASIFWKDRDSVYLGANQRFARDAGLQHPEELVGKTDYDMVWTKEQADFYRECDRKVMSDAEPQLNIEETQTQSNGKDIDLLTSKVPLRDESGEVTGLLGIYMDVTKLKQTETTLRKSEARLQTLFDSAAEYIFVIDLEGEIVMANRYVYQQSGYGVDEVIGKNIKQFFTEDSKNVCDCNFPKLRQSGSNRAEIEFVCKDGRVIQMECSATAVPDEHGDFTTFLIIQRDVTERNRTAAALANSEARFRAIFNSTQQFIGVLDPDGVLLQVNQTALDFAGLMLNDVVGRPFWDTYWWCYSSDVQHRLRTAIQQAAQGALVRYEEDVRGKDYTLKTIDFTLKPVTNQRGEIVLIIPEGRDITDIKQAAAERQQHQNEMAHVTRVGIMGEMASGMAHELNQPLTALASYCGTAETLAKSLPAPPPQLCHLLERASEQAHRAGEIIRHIRQFIGKESDHKQPVELDQIVKDLNILLEPELKNAHVGLEHHLGGQGRCVIANKVQIEQVLVNLVTNSIDAIQSIHQSDGKVIVNTRLLADESMEVTVADNGPGIETEMTGKLFEPFQTNKTAGLGMGLSLSRSIIEAHGGKMWADKHRHSGALFGFCLAVCEQTDESAEAELPVL